jgi:hypothetical protein
MVASWRDSVESKDEFKENVLFRTGGSFGCDAWQHEGSGRNYDNARGERGSIILAHIFQGEFA